MAVVHGGRYVDLAFDKPPASGLEQRHFQYVRQDRVEIGAAAMDVLAIVEIFGRAQLPEQLLAHHVGEAHDRVERRAQLVAHIGEKIRFGDIGRLGLRLLEVILLGQRRQLLRLRFQCLPGVLQLGDMSRQSPFREQEMLFVALQRGDVGAHRNIAAVPRAALVDLQPASVDQSDFKRARVYRREFVPLLLDLDERRPREVHDVPVAGAWSCDIAGQVV